MTNVEIVAIIEINVERPRSIIKLGDQGMSDHYFNSLMLLSCVVICFIVIRHIISKVNETNKKAIESMERNTAMLIACMSSQGDNPGIGASLLRSRQAPLEPRSVGIGSGPTKTTIKAGG